VRPVIALFLYDLRVFDNTLTALAGRGLAGAVQNRYNAFVYQKLLEVDFNEFNGFPINLQILQHRYKLKI